MIGLFIAQNCRIIIPLSLHYTVPNQMIQQPRTNFGYSCIKVTHKDWSALFINTKYHPGTLALAHHPAYPGIPHLGILNRAHRPVSNVPDHHQALGLHSPVWLRSNDRAGQVPSTKIATPCLHTLSSYMKR